MVISPEVAHLTIYRATSPITKNEIRL